METRTFSSLHRFSMGLRSGDWLGHSRTLMCFFLSHSFVVLAVHGFWVIVMLQYQSTTHFQCPVWLQCPGPDGVWPRPSSFDAVQLPCPLSRKTPPKHNVSTSMFDGGDGVLGVIGSIPPPPNTASLVYAKELDFGLI